MMRKTVCSLVLTAMLAGTQAGAWDGSGITMSYWAQEGVAAAYESGAVSDRFEMCIRDRSSSSLCRQSGRRMH